VPTLIAGAAAKGATPAGAQQLVSSVNSVASVANVANTGNVTNLLGGGAATQDLLKTGGSLVSSLFGSNATAITDAISSATGVGGKSISGLLALGAPLVASVIGKTLGAGNVNPTSVSNLMAEQGQYVKDLVPPGVNNLLGAPATTTTRPPVAEPAPARVVSEPAPRPTYTAPVVEAAAPKASPSIWRWLLPLLAVLAGLALLYLLLRPRPVDNTVACTNLANLEQTVATVPAITADTKVTELKDTFGKIKGVYDTVGPAAQALTGVNLSGLSTAFNTLDGLVNGLTGETVGAASTDITTAVNDVKSQYTTLKTNIGCR
jgi:hypothetical protein